MKKEVITLDLIISAVTHRTGSTLLQRICNERKKTIIWGEHWGIVYNFSKIYKKIQCYSKKGAQVRELYFSEKKPNLWTANLFPEIQYTEKAIISSLKTFFKKLYMDHCQDFDIIGFKEVRYGEAELKLLRKCYPDIPIFLLIRNPIDCWKSLPESWKIPITQFVDKWTKNTSYYHKLNNKDSNTYLIRYEDIVDKKVKTINMIQSIAKVTKQQYEDVLKYKVHSFSSEIPENEYRFIKRHCKDLMIELGY